MDAVHIIESLGPFIAILLAALLLTRECLAFSIRTPPWLMTMVNVIIVPLLILFSIDIILQFD